MKRANYFAAAFAAAFFTLCLLLLAAFGLVQNSVSVRRHALFVRRVKLIRSYVVFERGPKLDWVLSQKTYLYLDAS